jgi:hypothetical protein
MPWPDAKLKADKSLLKRTAFPWTILRPGLLTEDAATGQIEMGHIPLSPGIPVRVAVDACHADDGGSAQTSPPLFWPSSSAKTRRDSLWISPGAPRLLTRRSTLRSRRAKRSSMPSYYHSTPLQCRERVQPDLQRYFSWTRIGPNATHDRCFVLREPTPEYCERHLRRLARVCFFCEAATPSTRPAPTDVSQKK